MVSSKDKEMGELHLGVGTSQLQNGSYPQALEALLRAQSYDPTNPAIQNNLGLAFFMRERFDLAEKHIREALSLQPNYTDARNNLARVLIERGQYSQAIVEAQKVINDLTYASPEKGLINQGIAYFKLGNFSTAKENFLKALTFQRDNCMANSYLGRSLFEMKQYKSAAEALDTAVGFCQRMQFDEPHYYSAIAYFELGQKAKSENRFEELIRLYPQGKFSEKAKNMLEIIRK
jgi:type IV pilus assembly protein PilF